MNSCFFWTSKSLVPACGSQCCGEGGIVWPDKELTARILSYLLHTYVVGSMADPRILADSSCPKGVYLYQYNTDGIVVRELR